MKNIPSSVLEVLRRQARQAAARSHVPYSNRPAGAVLLLEDGRLVPGVRVESASFSLTIPALLNAFTTAVAARRHDVVAAVLSHASDAGEAAFMTATPAGTFTPAGPDAFVRPGTGPLPAPAGLLSPFLDVERPDDPGAGLRLAREVARRAHVPASNFPVGCVLETAEGLVPGVNVEHEDWARILCAERNALGTAVTYGLTKLHTLYLSCLRDPDGTPCGACRQLLTEQAPALVLWMDRGAAPPASSRPEALLPGFFSGGALRKPAL
ncbi:cytidine deaminase [Rhodocaloribacter litoris]|uniref:cytidine deaminase n=1 Tax=Rhodocaloribacter litoris TaxID=2558931 RepID=UPI001424240C|nr:cytidine deaminase [Rhodocaloribacter litoris]QXD14713.1 cytidine deaminase [Rhodocaloribacter litoris]